MLRYLTILWLRLRLAHETSKLEADRSSDAQCQRVHNALNDLLRYQRHGR